jgi:putative ABC transport system permease protein
MDFLLRTWAIVHIVVKRLLAQFGLAFVTIIGLVASITLVVSVPLYADAVYHRTLLEKISTIGTAAQSDPNGNVLPFSFLFNYYGGWSGARQWEDIQPVQQLFRDSTASILQMPTQSLVSYTQTDGCELFPYRPDPTAPFAASDFLTWVNLGTMSDIENHITLTEGKFPASGADANGVIEVLVSLPLANKLGLQVGEQYSLRSKATTETGSTVANLISVRLSGVWQPKDAAESYWFLSPLNLVDIFLVPEATFSGPIAQTFYGEVVTARWYIVMDGSNISTDQIGALLGRIGGLHSRAAALLPNIQLSSSPVDALKKFQAAATQLSILLYAFAAPILGLILAFISLVGNLSTERKRNEMAVTRSRGATSLQVLGSVLLETAILGLTAFLISLPLAMLVTRLIGETHSFMDFSANTGLNVQLTRSAIIAGLLTVLVASLACLGPALGAVRYTIVSYKQEQARNNRPPFWQRAWLDFLLLIPTGYGAYLLNQQGSVLAAGSQDPLGNPLLFLVPSLMVVALTLIVLRLLPLLMAGLSWLAGQTRFVGLLLASRQLARSPGHYNTPFLILVFTLSLSAYTASLAQTLDQHLVTRTYYQVGADMQFTEVGEPRQNASFPIPVEATPAGPDFLFFPVTEYLKIPGIQAVTRVGSYNAVATLPTGGITNGKFYGIDRLDFPRAAFWQRNFARASLIALMNALGAVPNGVLVPEKFLKERSLKEGDSLQLSVSTDIGNTDIDFQIVGSFRLFPTWYEEENNQLFVGNLDYLFEQAGGESPYHVWVHTKPGVNYTSLGELDLRQLNFRIVHWDAAYPRIVTEQQRPEQQGIFGFLFIGFAAAAILTVVGFLLYALFSYQRRFIELGVLRAGGLSRGQMATYLAFELIFLLFFGAGVGTTLGAWISVQFIPYLQVGSEVTARIPPFRVIIAWPAIYQLYGLFALLFGVTLVLLVVALQRMKIFQAIKMGETV